MSKEYESLAKVGSCSVFARKVLTSARRLGTDSLGLLEALLSVEGSVVVEALESLGHQRDSLLSSLQEQRQRSRPEDFAHEPNLLKLAERKAREEGFPLSSDHLLEVLWDEDTQAYLWLRTVADAESLEQALNSVRYPEEPDSGVSRTDKPSRPSPTSSAQRLVG